MWRGLGRLPWQCYANEAELDALRVQQIGPDQDAFFDAYRDHVLPRLQGTLVAVG